MAKKRLSIIHLLYMFTLVATAITLNQLYGVLAAIAVCWYWYPILSAEDRPKFGFLDALAIFAGVLLMAFLMVPSQFVHSSINSVRTWNNLKQINLALREYEAVHGCFPPPALYDSTGSPIHSWRVLLLPFLDQRPLYQEYDFSEAWDGPNNRQLLARMPEVYLCPGAVGPGGTTNYCVVIDEQSCFPEKRCRKKTDIVDGMRNTIGVLEYGGRNIPWSAPQDPTMNQLLEHIAGWGKYSRPIHTSQRGLREYYLGENAITIDGDTLLIDSPADPQLVRSTLEISDGSGPAEIEAITGSEHVHSRLQVSKVLSLVAFILISLAPSFWLVRIPFQSVQRKEPRF